MSNCQIILTARICVMPTTNNDIVTVERHDRCTETDVEIVEKYRVILKPNDAKRITSAGYVGAALSIRGKLRLQSSPEIIAEKAELLEAPNNNQPQLAEFLFQPIDSADNAKLSHLFQTAERKWHTRMH